MTEVFFANGLRLAVLVTLVAIAALSVDTLRRFAGKAHRNPAGKAHRNPPEARKALHITKVAASHIGLLVILAADNLSEFGEGMNLQLGFVVPFATLTISALLDLRFYQRRHGG